MWWPVIRFGSTLPRGEPKGRGMKRILTIISATAFTAAAVVAFVAFTSGGSANAQDSTPTPPSTETQGFLTDEAIDALSTLAREVVDRLAAERVITQDQASEALAALEGVKGQLADVDWELVETQLGLALARFQREIAEADWNDIRDRLERELAQLDELDWEGLQFGGRNLDDLNFDDFDVDSLPWTELQDGFEEFKREMGSLDPEAMIKELEKHLGDVKWDEWSSQWREELEQFNFQDLERQMDQLRKQLDGMNLDDLAGQF